jgi:hypothetical protein
MNKRKIFLGLGLFSSASIIILMSIGINKYISNIKNNNKLFIKNKNEIITIGISGAIEYPDLYEIKKGTKLLEIIKRARLKSGADLNNIDLNLKLEKNQLINIPFKKNNSISIREVNNVGILEDLGIKKDIAKIILSYFIAKDYVIT